MKRCPTCDKTFDDKMKFCQTDGTLLVEDAPPSDPYKTVVGNQSDIASAIPPLDPFKTMVASPPKGDDLLQLPEDQDSLKTMVVSQDEMKEALKSDKSDTPKLDLPASPPSGRSVPIIEPKPPSNQKDFSTPPLPKNNEPSLNPPSFGDLSAPPKADLPKPPPNFDEPASPNFDSKSAPRDLPPQSPFGSQDNKPIPSPFDGSMIGYQPPTAPPPFDPPKPQFKEPEPAYASQSASDPSPFQPPSPFEQNDPFNAPMQQNEWTPPPVPESNWQNQDFNANMSAQPVAGGENKTLAIVSLVLGILSIVCCGLLAGIPAIITGFMAKNNVDSNPAQYGGRGMALAGMVLGGISIVLTIIVVILQVALGAFGRF